MQVTSPFDLDWGKITPEAFNEQKNEVVFMYNFDMSSEENITRCKVFVTGKIIWAAQNIPPCNYRVVFDLRGQALTLLGRARKLKEDIIDLIGKEKLSIQSLDIEIII